MRLERYGVVKQEQCYGRKQFSHSGNQLAEKNVESETKSKVCCYAFVNFVLPLKIMLFSGLDLLHSFWSSTRG